MLDSIKILQANLNKSIQATESTLQLAVELRVDIIAVQEPWLTPTRNNDYADTRSTSHAAYLQILPQSEPKLRPRVLFYISRTLLAETHLLEGFTSDPDAIALVVQKGNHKFNIFNLYNERGIGDIKTIPRVLLNTNTRLPESSILLLDANEHHPWWDPLCTSTSPGAPPFVEWIESQNLSLLNTPGTGTFFRPHLSRESVLDLSLVTPDLADKAIDWQVTTETGSDHYGLLFSIRSDTDQVDNPINQRKFNTKKADWPLFQKTLNEAIQNNITLQHISEINDPRKQDCKNLILEEDQELQSKLEEIGEAITQVIQLAADKAIPKVKLGPKPKPWWNQELTKLRRELTHCQRVYTQQLQQLSIQEAYLFKKDFLIARNTYARAIKDAKKRHWNSFLEQETPQSIYKAMAYTKDQKVEKIPPIHGEILEKTFKGKCKAFRKALFPPPPTAELPSFLNYQESIWDWPQLSISELEQACSSKVKSSTPGPDAITQDIITATFKFNPEILFIAYSILFNYGYHPRCWKAATGAILKKPSKLDYSLPKAYRVITLLNSLGKVLERIIAKRLASLAETTNLLHPSQIGGRNKKSAIDAALLLVDQIQHKKQQGQITSTVFVDVKGAFDHVIHNRFLDRLKKLGLPISLICWAKSFLSNRTLRLAFDNKIEEFSKIRAGIPQGSPVSPIFFLIYIRDLFPALQSFQLSYIDDLSLTTSSTSLKKNIRALQKEIATLFAKGEQLDIIFDTSKTELIHFTAKKERIERALILPNNDRIEHKDTVKWLGIYLDNRLSFKSHVSIRVSQARQAFYRLGRLANIELGLSTHAIRQLYLACVTSVSDYGAQIYWQNQPYATKKLQSLHNLACRKTLGVFRTAPTVPTSLEASLLPPAIRLNSTIRNYASRANLLANTHPIAKAITRIQSTNLQRSKKPNQHRQLQTITNAIPKNNKRDTEQTIPYRFRPWDTLNYTVTVSQKSKEEEANAHQAYIKTRLDNYTTIYSDASQTQEGKGIGVGIAVYNSTQQEIYSETVNIGQYQLVYNGELEGITRAFEYAAKNATTDQEFEVYADNQAAIYRLKNLSDNPGQHWQLRCLKAANTIRRKQANIHLLWAPGHTDIVGNERADYLAKEATKEDPRSTTKSIAYLGTTIKRIQQTEQRQEYEKYKARATALNKATYSAKYPLKISKTIQMPQNTKRVTSSAFYSLKLGHGYFNSYLKRFKKRDSNRCTCQNIQTPEHLLLYCHLYKDHRKTLLQTIKHRPVTLPLLLHTSIGIEATLAFITSTRIGTRKWYLGQPPEDLQRDTV
ncbi:hypothetical protein PtrM4_112750 [Pyrenophora tritici-repentis]|uniref:Reverse transcriptase n=1 Tax=Pyrenophora tritici-repentis TaxID=45151 RepID=A0A834RSA2_9PLEO|nr:hypothetical protein PtrM4_112750 [Pyrenophora tritici-repentis]